MSLNYLLYRAKYLLSRHLPLSIPVDIGLELSSYCNMRCKYCYHVDQSNLPFERKFMSHLVASKILVEAMLAKVNSVKFNWRGEPTLNPHFYQISEMAKDFASRSTFIDRVCNTNMNFKSDRQDIFQGLSLMTKVKISFDSFDKTVFLSQRAGADFERIKENIDILYNLPNRKNTLVIQAIRTSQNQNEDIKGLVDRYWPKAELSIRNVIEGRTENIGSLAVKKRDFNNRQPCYQAFARLIFDGLGYAYPCCPDIKSELCLGNIFNNSIEEIFNSKQAKQLKISLKNKTAFESEPCASCSSFESYEGYKPNLRS